MELHNSAVLSDAPWTIAKLDRVLNFFYLLLYKLLKVFLFFLRDITSFPCSCSNKNTQQKHAIRIIQSKKKI